MVDAAGELIYVGKAKCLRSRLLSYFRKNSRDAKAGRIIQCTRAIAWEFAPCEFGALLRELELIRRWTPRFNVQGQPLRRRRSYLCIGRAPAPYVFLAPRPPKSARWVYGPVPGGVKVREAVRRLNEWYGLRDCPKPQTVVFADQGELFPLLRTPGCLRHEIGACLAPCAAVCTQKAYSSAVRSARAFLEGNDDAPLQTLERDMQAASTALQFERAASLRDKLDVLTWLRKHLQRLRDCGRESFVYTAAGHDGAEIWYLIHGGRVRSAFWAPVDEPGADALAAAMADVLNAAAPGPPSLEEIDGVLLAASWFRKHESQRLRTLTLSEARQVCDRRRTALTPA
jgi:excinuclease ABC subunit C